MKRIIPCPKCEAKLAVFDLGKPINQKCPKCGNAFVVESEEKKPAEKKDEPAAQPAETAVASTQPVPGQPAAAPAKPAEEPKPADTAAKPAEPEKAKETEKPSDAPAAPAAAEKKADAPKEIQLKKPADAPVAAAKPRTETKPAPLPAIPETAEPHAGGGSILSTALTIGLLMMIIIMQVISQKRANSQYANLIQHLQYIEKQLAR